MSSSRSATTSISNRDRICLACRQKSCCSYYTVTVTVQDVLRIAQALQIGPMDFLSACTVTEGVEGTFLLSPEGPRYAMTLAKRQLPEATTSPCVFLLKTNEGHGLCGLGELRPSQCRRFPVYMADGFVAIANEPAGCVRTWSYGDLDLDEERRGLLVAATEEADHQTVVEEWNRRVRDEGRERSLDEFYSFIVNRAMKLQVIGAGATGPCSSCRKRCCEAYTVSITGHDAWLIGKRLHLPLELFLICFPVADQNGRGFLLEPGGTKYEIALDKAGEYRKGNACVFWLELPSGGGRCGIYPHRPMVCQTYPTYQSQEMVVLRDDVLCPPGAWNLVGMDLPVFQRRHSWFRMERDIYDYFVSGWNRGVERGKRTFTISDYYTALMNVYEHIHEWMQGIASDALEEFARQWGEMLPTAPNPLFADLSAPDLDGSWHANVAALRESIQRSAPRFVEPRRLVIAAE